MKKKLLIALVATIAVVTFQPGVVKAETNENAAALVNVTEAVEENAQVHYNTVKEAYEDYFKVGCALSSWNMDDDTLQNMMKSNFNSLTCENEMKPDYVLDHEATLDYVEKNHDDLHPQVSLTDGARKVLDFARDNNIAVRGHTLIWHGQTPEWIFKEGFSEDGEYVNKIKMLARMRNYIKAVFELVEREYPTVDFYQWDVVNEAVSDGEELYRDYSNWYKIIGDRYIDYAFLYARMYAPKGTKLAYNDYNEYIPAKTEKIVEITSRLKKKGLIDVIGLQSHLSMDFPSLEMYETGLRRLASTGIDLAVTELDLGTNDTSKEGLEAQAKQYEAIFNLYKQLKDEGVNLDSVTIWGTTDNRSWRKENSPLLFDENCNVKPAFWGVVDPSRLEE